MRKNNILITGSAGFLGSIYAAHLSKNNNIYAVDIDLKRLQSLKKKNNNINIFKIDVTSEKQIKNLFENLKKKDIFI